MTSLNRHGGVLLAIAMGTILSSTGAPRTEYGGVEVLRDRWGIPHVFSETDAGSMYGLGHATAEERGFQMTYNLRIIQGRLAEIVGDRAREGRRETAVAHDRQARTVGWSSAAARIAAQLDPSTQELLRAYCEGVNDSFASQRATGTLHPLFARLGVEPETWSPADCLLSWWHLGQFFATDGTRDLLAWRNRRNRGEGQREAPVQLPAWVDDTTAVVQREDANEDWLRRVEAFGRDLRKPGANSGVDGPKFSHAWVTGGKRTTTGAAVLMSDPQTPVRNPSLWMEFHVKGKTFDARGIGVPGSPALLIGFNARIAWGLTALGADQADLFRLETDPAHPDAYRWDGTWRTMTRRTERIRVKDGEDRTLIVRETHLGPVMSEFCFGQPGDPEVALKRVPLCEKDRDTVQAVFAAMRATQAAALSRALEGWRFPSANCVYGDADGHIGYAVLGAIPVRPPQASDADGTEALAGNGDSCDWSGFVPPDLLPRVSDPPAGVLFSANHRPVGAFYPIPLGLSTGSMGDTIRSWRLRERLSGEARFSPEAVLDVHFDPVNPARREIVRLGVHLRATRPESLSEPALRALEVLEPWWKGGASSDLRFPGASLATRISTYFRFVTTPLTRTFGGGESGLARFLKDAASRIQADPKAQFDEAVSRFIDRVLADAWQESQPGGGRAPGRGGAATAGPRLGWFDSLDGFGSLDSTRDMDSPAITCLDGQTLKSQASQSYTQWVPLHDVDSAQTLTPIGHSDRPESPHRFSTLALWGEGKLHPAPLSRAAVDKISVERQVLSAARVAGRP